MSPSDKTDDQQWSKINALAAELKAHELGCEQRFNRVEIAIAENRAAIEKVQATLDNQSTMKAALLSGAAVGVPTLLLTLGMWLLK